MLKRTHRASRSLLLLAVGAVALQTGALAADPSDKKDSAYLTALKACQAEPGDAARLACFDKAVSTMVTASEQGELRVVDRAEVQETRRKLFGFSLPDFGIFGGGDHDEKAEQIQVLQTTIAKVRPSENAGWILVTAEGAVWQVDNVPARLLTPKVGQSLEIRPGALTSYFLRINGQPGLRGRRIA
jgi:hypothetical protein